ncbi:tol-pal system-associated acyl-CoA thioesterase [Rhodoferax sp.]|uniref:tol-pal system-associated acyl-CoA thioesterase n=1 Tax=Rhodoferax sp. TaxID=50421 RepID=UPI0008C6687B|nr:tol-pal system-associated acyl-CoA thioesterase [Rhodoferax sp.]OGB43018.1 MAG: tol-pal system-associated acyl-CoA thioesterase [Burkholderiales bacterium RIFOXYC2_FULL_59_8]OGB50424.1 MAG: tol-pal system-associated acyl-CoA thioesterase [Burkholderiales bacterium RIFOXYD12_FULL_59_19]OGB82212.1 MAG: tol-pal system-associated acyl-CoA thioesterase [Burkholderiales bacterium RIFOXYD2_FULL_59_8]OGB82907.1 MAG: tol-pal system-associated acyl-CoA thioesterase [Burkholderiales bacterium RIFOXYC12
MSTPSPTTETFSWPVRVYWEDTDAGGIVFYANYLKFFERSRTEWLRVRGISQQTLKEATGGMFVVGEAQLRFLKSARLDDELLVTTSLLDAGRASMTIHQQALLSTPAGTLLLCEATIRAGWVDASTLKPARIPPHILNTLL